MKITHKMPGKYLDNDAEKPMIDLSNISLEKMDFVKEIAAMHEEEFHAKIVVYKAVASVTTNKDSMLGD